MPLDTEPPVNWGDAASYRKSASVEASQLNAPKEWTTGTGDRLHAKPGDWLLDDGQSQWTVADEVFRATYEQEPNGRWVKVVAIQAVRVDVSTLCHTLEGDAVAHPGDWVVRNPAGEVWPIDAATFQRTYQRCT